MINHPFFTQRAQRRERRLASFSGVGEALHHVASGWDLQERLNGEAFGKPSTLPETIKKAVASVRDTLDQIGEFPVPPIIEYQSVRSVRAAAGGTEQTPLIADGVIMLQARFLTKTGVRDSFDVPVLVREGQVMQPSVILHDGTMKVLAPSSVREMVARGTFTQQAPSRGLFSGPLAHDEVLHWNQIERDSKTQTRLNPGMFSVNGSRGLLRAAVQGDKQYEEAQKQAQYQDSFSPEMRGVSLPEIRDLVQSMKSGVPREQILQTTGKQFGLTSKDLDDFMLMDERGLLRQAQLGEQPSRAHMGFEASPGSRAGDRIVTMVTWDPDRVESMSDQNLQHSIRSFVLELGSKKEWRDWGTIADVQIDEFDRDGSARVSFKSSEISAPQLSAADFEDLSKKGRRTAAIGPSQDGTDLQPAERDKSQQYHVGEEVKLTKGQLLRNRGGGVDTVPKGTKGKIVGDMFGDGLTLKVVFDSVSSQPMVVPASHVKHASSVTAEKVIDEIANLRRAGYSPIDVILTARQRYGTLGEEALRQAKMKGLLDW